MREGSIPDCGKVASSSPSLISSCPVIDALCSWLLVEVDSVQGEHAVGLLGGVLKADHFRGNSAVCPANQPFEAVLTFVHPFDVCLLTKMTGRPSALDFDVVQIVFSIGRSFGRPFRAASFSSALPHERSLADDLGVGEGAKEGILEVDGIDDETISPFTLSFESRQPFRVAYHLHLPLPDGVASIEEALESKTRPGVGSVHQCSRLRRVLLEVVLDHLVVAVASGFIGSADPEELSVVGIVHTNDGFVGHPVRTQNRLISAKQSVAALDHQLRVKSHIVLLSGSRSRELLVANRPGMSGDKVVMRPARFVGPSPGNQAMLQNLFEDKQVTRMVNDSGQFRHQLRHQVWAHVGFGEPV